MVCLAPKPQQQLLSPSTPCSFSLTHCHGSGEGTPSPALSGALVPDPAPQASLPAGVGLDVESVTAQTAQGRCSSAAPQRALLTHHPPGKKPGWAEASPAAFGDGANAMCQSRHPAGEQRGGSMALQDAGGSISPPLLLPSVRDAAFSTCCAWEGP